MSRATEFFLGSNKPKTVSVTAKGRTLADRQKVDRAGTIALAAAYTKAVTTRKQYLSKYASFKSFYLVDAIVNAIYEDALTPDASTGDILTVTSANPKANRELEKLQKKIDLDQMIASFAEDLIGDGEYTLSVDVQRGEGVVSIKDDVDQTSIVALYDKGMPVKYLRQGKQAIHVDEPYDYIHFCMGGKKLRIKIMSEFENKKASDDIPSYARIGKPLFYGTLSKISELQLLESLIPAAKLSELTRGSLVGVGIPNGVTPDDAFEICRKYENTFNSAVGVNRDLHELTTADIIGVSGKVKAVPLFGDKGSLDSLSDSRKNSSIDEILSSVEDLRTIICTSIGFPPELLFGGDGKAELLKRYARYLRRLKAMQSCIAQGVKQLAIIHLKNCADKDQFDELSISDISVEFNNQLISIDELEKLEFSDALVSTVKDLFEFFSEINTTEGFEGSMNLKNIKLWLNDKLALIQSDHQLVNLDDPDDEDRSKVTISKKSADKQTDSDDSDDEHTKTDDSKKPNQADTDGTQSNEEGLILR